jgi:hypothetical protein
MKRTTYILILIVVILASLLWFLSLCKCNVDTKNVALAMFSSGLFAFLIEIGFWLNDIKRFSFLEGKWVRKKFFNRNGKTSDVGYDDLTDRYENVSKIDPNIEMKYKGDGEYHGKVFYEEGTVNFIIILNKNNILSGSGTYQYEITKSQTTLPDIGHFELIIDNNKKSIYISHENKLPNGTSKGVEVWTKKEE